MKIREKIKEKTGKIALPAWVFIAFTVLYNELMLHIWITDTLQAGRLVTLTAFALGLGGVLAFLVSLIPSSKASKWTAVVLAVIVTVVWVTEYFISDAYKVFMTPNMIISGAGGVAEDYFGLVMSLLARNLWRIGLMLLPIVLYGVFCHSGRTDWKLRGALAAAAAVLYLLGVGAAKGLTNDAARLDTAYDFDSVVRCFGLNMGLTLDAVHGSAEEQEPEFVAAPTMPVSMQETEETETTVEPEVVYDYNVMEQLDFEALAQSEKNLAISSLHSYVASLTPSRQNAYTGLFEGKNLILITAEAFTAEVIDPERTPTLYRLANEGIKFTNYYQPAWGGSTTGGEFSNVVGIVPTTAGMCMREALQQDLFLTMGHQLQKLGYFSAAYHNHNADFYDRDQTHVHLGYDNFYGQYGGLEGITTQWPESDLELMDVSVPQYIDQQPFSIYYMTVSGHCLYSLKGNAMARKNYDLVADMECAETVKYYYAAQQELEYGMESLVRQLEEAGIADDTVIVLSADHYPYGLESSGTWQNASGYLRELYGVEEYGKFVRDHNALIIWSGCLEDMDLQVDDPVYSLDILPTLSNLFGVDYDSRLLVGRDVFSEEIPLVLWPDFSWKTDKGTYDSVEGTFTPAEGAEVDESYVEYVSSLVTNKITYSRSVQSMDYFQVLSDYLAEQGE